MYSLYEQDVLANLLFAASHGRQGGEMAERLMKCFGSFRNVFAADRHALEKNGLTEAQAALILSMRPIARRCAAARFGRHPDLSDRRTLEDYIRALYVGARNEQFILLCMNRQERLIEARPLAEGTLRGIRMQVRTLMESVVHTGADCVIFCHNHPGGQAAFSRADIQSTRIFWAQLKTIGVPLLDHILYADDAVVSMRESCHLDETFFFPAMWQAEEAKH